MDLQISCETFVSTFLKHVMDVFPFSVRHLLCVITPKFEFNFYSSTREREGSVTIVDFLGDFLPETVVETHGRRSKGLLQRHQSGEPITT